MHGACMVLECMRDGTCRHDGLACMCMEHSGFATAQQAAVANAASAPAPPLQPQGGLDKKRLHYIEGGQAGNRENYINNLVRTMN